MPTVEEFQKLQKDANDLLAQQATLRGQLSGLKEQYDQVLLDLNKLGLTGTATEMSAKIEEMNKEITDQYTELQQKVTECKTALNKS